MATVPVHPRVTRQKSAQNVTNPLPQLLQTPAGLALLELQGTINLPPYDPEDEEDGVTSPPEVSIGRLVFPEYDPSDAKSTAWMKRVYMYVGKHQRLFGEVKKLPKALAIIRRKKVEGASMDVDQAEELEVVEIVKWKILFSTRPEPVGTWNGEV